MPNWCSNHITVRGSQQREIQRLAEAFREGKFCDAVIPVPEDLQITAGYLGDGDAQTELERKTADNVDKHGFGNWYEFCTGRWGTKWDVGDEHSIDLHEDGLGFVATFESAWSPPIGVYEALDEQGFEVSAFYYEPGMAYCGRWELGADDYYEIGGQTADEVEATIPSDIDECFGITDNMREWEEEERREDDLYRWVKDSTEEQSQ